MVHVVFFYRQTKLSNNEKHKSRHSHLNVWLAIKFSGPRSSGPNDSARDKVHIGRHGPEVDLIPLQIVAGGLECRTWFWGRLGQVPADSESQD